MLKPRPRKRRWRAKLFGLLLVAALALSVYMYISAGIVRIVYTDLYLSDLPDAFDGKTVLLVTDVHLDAFNSPERAARLMDDLQWLYPDMLLMGGDYTGIDAWSFVRALWSGEDLTRTQADMRDRFFTLIRRFSAPLGKYGVAGNHDAGVAGLKASMALGGVQLLRNERIAIDLDGARMTLVGLDDWTTGERIDETTGSLFASDDCVMVLSHDPAAFDAALRPTSRESTRWMDVMFAGHTHGGQVNLPLVGRALLLTIGNPERVTGWHEKDGAHLLISNGVGTTGLPFRFGAPPEVQLITLRCRR